MCFGHIPLGPKIQIEPMPYMACSVPRAQAFRASPEFVAGRLAICRGCAVLRSRGPRDARCKHLTCGCRAGPRVCSTSLAGSHERCRFRRWYAVRPGKIAGNRLRNLHPAAAGDKVVAGKLNHRLRHDQCGNRASSDLAVLPSWRRAWEHTRPISRRERLRCP